MRDDDGPWGGKLSVVMMSSSRLVLVAAATLVGGCQILSGLTDYQTGGGTGGSGASSGSGTTSATSGTGATGGTGGSGLPLGADCKNGDECDSNYCVDEVCCENECTGPCLKCNYPDEQQGACWVSSAGTDPDGDCEGGVCDGSAKCAVGTVMWAERFIDDATPPPAGPFVGIDDQGNVVVAGSFKTNINGAGADFTADGEDFFLVMLDPEGPPNSPKWVNQFGQEAGDQVVTALAVDGSSGNIAVTGTFDSSFTLCDTLLEFQSTDQNAFIAVVSSEDDCLWAKAFHATTLEAQAVTFDHSGKVIVAGIVKGQLNLGGSLLVPLGLNIFAAKYEPSNGTHIWSDAFGGALTTDVQVGGVAADENANIFLTGSFAGTLAFGDVKDTLIADTKNPSGPDAFVAKLKWGGNKFDPSWSKRFGGQQKQQPAAVAVDHDGNPVIAGYFWGELGLQNLTSLGGTDLFVTKLTAGDGKESWTRGYGTTKDDRAFGVAVDASDNVVIAGDFAETGLDLGGGKLTCLGSKDAFVAKYSKDGHHLWSKSIAAAGEKPATATDQQATGVAADPSTGHVVVTGYVTGDVDFGQGGTGGNGPDPFVAKYKE
ncbi:MAG: hypothetical protein KKI08_04055 [Armatimonadetes bacterium]|nr:hypothetical protein [Armatimonadota bacterium]